MKRCEEFEKSILAMQDELTSKQEDISYRLEKYVLEKKILVIHHIRFYYQESGGRILSVLALHELTNEVVVLDAPKNGDINPRLINTQDLTSSLTRVLSEMGWVHSDALDEAYRELKHRLR